MSSSKGSPIRRLELFQKEPNLNDALLTRENQRLTAELHSKNMQLQQIYQQNKLLKLRYDDQILNYEKTISLMQKQLKESEYSREQEFNIIKQRYDKIVVDQSESLKNYHEHQIQFLLKQIANLRTDSVIKQQKMALKQTQLESMKESYEREIHEKISEINNLHKKYLTFEENMNKQIKEINSKRELERSRTSGLVSSRKENNQFMDKQLRKLNEEVLDKTIRIESISRELNKMKKKLEETEKNYTKKFQEMIAEREEETAEREAHFAKIEKSLKEQILEFKAKELKLLNQIDTQTTQIQNLQSQVKGMKVSLSEKQTEIKEMKNLLQKQRDDHASEISRLLKERKKKSSNLGSSRSLGSSLKDSGQMTENSGINPQLKKMDSVRLPTVKQESPDKSQSKSLENSQFSAEQDNDLSKAIYHYDTLIDELKRSQASEIQMLNHKIEKLTRSYQEKQQQVLDILTRFSPLVKIHAEEKSVEQDRKQRIQRHWKADLGVLEILLNKYKIKTF